MRKLFFTAAIAAVSLVSCSDEKNEQITELQLEVGSVHLLEEFATTASVKIGSGSGEYDLEVQNPAIAVASLELESYENGTVRIVAKQKGTTTVTVTDRLWGQTEQIEVSVSEPRLFLEVADYSFYIGTDDATVRDDIEALLIERMPFRKGYVNIFTREEKGKIYGFNDTEFQNDRTFRHNLEDGETYLEVSEKGEEELQVWTLRLLEEPSTGYTSYLKFFRLTPDAETLMTMPSHRDPEIWFEEDLTEIYGQDYPQVLWVKAEYGLYLNFGSYR